MYLLYLICRLPSKGKVIDVGKQLLEGMFGMVCLEAAPNKHQGL